MGFPQKKKGDLGIKYTPQIVWEMRIRVLEEGWTMAFTDGSGLDDKAAGGFCSNPNRLDKDRQPDLSGDRYLGIKATHFDEELAGIALALVGHNDMNMEPYYQTTSQRSEWWKR